MTNYKNMSPVFYDCEASSLDGFPIEIGWAYVQPSGVIHTESYLISPDSDWDIRGSWERRAERLHGISLDEVLCNGTSPVGIARLMNANLSDRQLFADSSYDESWLLQIFDAAGTKPEFMVRRMLSDVLIQQFAASSGIGPEAYATILADAHKLSPMTHRAGPDARHWASVWLAVMQHRQLGSEK